MFTTLSGIIASEAGSGGRRAHQALRIEARQQAVGYRRVDVARSEVLLLESGGANRLNSGELPAASACASSGRLARAGRPKIVVDRLDHRVMIALDVRDGVRPRIGRDEDQRHADSPGKRQTVRAVGEDARRDVVVKAVRLIVGDDDRALFPDLRVRRDRVDHAGRHGLADLPVGVARVVVVARLRRVNRGDFSRRRVGVGDRRRQPHLVRVAAADVEHAAFGQGVVRHVGEEIGHAAEVRAKRRRVGKIAEILRPLVMADIGFMRSYSVRVGRLEVVALLVPAPVDGIGSRDSGCTGCPAGCRAGRKPGSGSAP